MYLKRRQEDRGIWKNTAGAWTEKGREQGCLFMKTQTSELRPRWGLITYQAGSSHLSVPPGQSAQLGLGSQVHKLELWVSEARAGVPGLLQVFMKNMFPWTETGLWIFLAMGRGSFQKIQMIWKPLPYSIFSRHSVNVCVVQITPESRCEHVLYPGMNRMSYYRQIICQSRIRVFHLLLEHQCIRKPKSSPVLTGSYWQRFE
jgi:hypothetical protein